MTSQKVMNQSEIDTIERQHILYLGRANHFMNGEAVGGNLYLLSDKIYFQSNLFNLQNHEQVIKLDQIKDVSFYNTLGIIPNGFAITTQDGGKEKFVVNKRKIWKEEIEKLTNNIA